MLPWGAWLLVALTSAAEQCASGDQCASADETLPAEIELEPPERTLPLRPWSASVPVRHLRLSDGHKVRLEVVSKSDPVLFQVTGFLTEDEADSVVEAAARDLEPAGTGTSGSGEGIRKNDVAFLWPENAAIVEKINTRAADLSRIPKAYFERKEPLNVVKYNTSGYYHAHYDSLFFSEFQEEMRVNKRLAIPHGPRYMTLLIYLNSADSPTVFPVGGWSDKKREKWMSLSPERREAKTRKMSSQCQGELRATPPKGSALMWYNHHVDSRGMLEDLDGTTWHAGCNVTHGSKWTANRWIQAPLPKSAMGA